MQYLGFYWLRLKMKTAAVVAFQFPKTAKRLSKLLQVPMAAEFNTQETAVPGAATAKRPTVLFAATTISSHCWMELNCSLAPGGLTPTTHKF